MKSSEHLALFALGVGTLGITFLLLFALSDRNTGNVPVIEKQMQVPQVQASVEPATEAPGPSSKELLEREVDETFAKAVEYIGRGQFVEEEHIALLERLEFYSGLSSINPQKKKEAEGLIKDMNLLLTLKESVARQVKLAGQINAAEADAHAHLTSGVRDKAEADKIIGRLESLYAIRGLTEEQNERIRSALAALKDAYKPKPPKPAQTAQTKRPAAPPAPAAEPAPKPAPVVKPAPAAEPTPKPAPVVKPAPVAEPAPKPAPVVKPAPVTQPAPMNVESSEARDFKRRYSRVMTRVSMYMTAKQYDRNKHTELTADLMEISRNTTYLDKDERREVLDTIQQMRKIDEMMRKK